MATNFTLKREKAVHSIPKVYEIEREHKAEKRKIMALKKELKAHERTDMAHAHPKSQKSAPLPSMRK
jgi:hypothetical protein